MSTTQSGLQRLMDSLGRFCEDRGLTVNIEKTKTLVFGARKCLKTPITLKGIPIDQVESFKYLGLVFHQHCSLKLAVDTLLASARKATFCLHSRCANPRITDPRLKCQLFDALVYPILSYGCEIWGSNPSYGEDLERWHRQFMRQVLGLPSHSPSSMLYGELGRMPLRHRWYKQTLRFWNRLLCTETSSILWSAFCEGSSVSRQIAKSGSTHHDIWSWHVEKMIVENAPFGPLSVYQELDVNEYSKRIFRSFRDKTMGDTSTMGFYYRTFKQEHAFSPYLSVVKNRHFRNILTRFRCGSHWLEISQGRYSKTPRDLRCCPNCTSVVEDEQHFLLECPIYNDIKQIFKSLFREDRRTLIDVFRPDQDLTKLARFMTICRERRVQLNRRSNESYGLCGPQGL